MSTDNTQFRLRFRVWRRKVRERNSDFSLRSTKLGWSSHVGPRLKVGVLGEGYAWILETPSFAKQEVRGVERFGFRKCSRDFLRSLLTLQEVGNLPNRVYFPSWSHFGLGLSLGAVWMAFRESEKHIFLGSRMSLFT